MKDWKVKTPEEILNQIKKAGLLESAGETEKTVCHVIAALYNADVSYVLLELLKENPEKVMRGISIAAYAVGAEKKLLYLPEKMKSLEQPFLEVAKDYEVEICYGIVDVRKNKENLLLHIAAAADIADLFANVYTPGTYVSVNGEKLQRVSYETKLNALVKGDDIKAVFAGNRYYSLEELEITVRDAKIFDGNIQVLTEKNCIVSEAEKTLLRYREQSCGKCVFCREGLIQLHYMQKEITEGRGKTTYLELTQEIGNAMNVSSLCTLGRNCAEAALSAVKKFPEEYDQHIKKKQCSAGVCTSFVNIYIDPQICQGCGDCVDVCPQDCIEGKAKYIHMIDEFDCTKCGKCIEECPEGAIQKTNGKMPKLPDRLTKVGKFKKR